MEIKSLKITRLALFSLYYLVWECAFANAKRLQICTVEALARIFRHPADAPLLIGSVSGLSLINRLPSSMFLLPAKSLVITIGQDKCGPL